MDDWSWCEQSLEMNIQIQRSLPDKELIFDPVMLQESPDKEQVICKKGRPNNDHNKNTVLIRCSAHPVGDAGSALLSACLESPCSDALTGPQDQCPSGAQDRTATI